MKLQGFCPMGCGETLILGDEGYATCGRLCCPDPTAVSLDLLCKREQMERVFASLSFAAVAREAITSRAVRDSMPADPDSKQAA